MNQVKIVKKAVVSNVNLPVRVTKNRSIMAQNVAKDVLATIGKGKPVVMKHVLKKNGYSEAVAKNPQQVTNSKSYKEIVDPFLKSMKDARDKALKRAIAMSNKASYRDAIDGLDKLTKNIQLLEGKATENVAARVVFLPSRGGELEE